MEERSRRARESSHTDLRDQPLSLRGNPPPPFIVIRRGGVHEWEHGSHRFPLNRGGTVVGHYGKAARVAVMLDIVLGPVKIAAVAGSVPAVGVVVADAWSPI